MQRVPQSESDRLVEARMKWANFVKERVVPITDVENVAKLVVDVTN